MVSQAGFEPATRCLEDISVLSAVLPAWDRWRKCIVIVWAESPIKSDFHLVAV